MTRPVNIYFLSRIHDEDAFNIVGKHQSQSKELQRMHYHEIESLKLLSDSLLRSGLEPAQMDGFFYSFHIPQIGKEFDLLRFTDHICLNIELKSREVPLEKILEQLCKNRHYLGHLNRRLMLYSVVTDTMTCYRLSLNGELAEVDFDEIADAVRKTSTGLEVSIDELFRASDYLVSPMETPERFIQGEYFLTSAQEYIKRMILGEA